VLDCGTAELKHSPASLDVTIYAKTFLTFEIMNTVLYSVYHILALLFHYSNIKMETHSASLLFEFIDVI
jgi:hypothetical protein